MKPNRTLLLTLFALLVGGIAAFFANQHMKRQVETELERARAEMVNVVVARTDLPQGARLTRQNVVLREIPKDYAHADALTRDRFFAEYENRELAFGLRAGETLLPAHVGSERPATFSGRVAPGRRAVSVPVDEISSISGMLEPGDIVDLLVSVDIGGRRQPVPLMQAIKVMAAGQRTDVDAAGERRSYTSVTLDVTPAQAQSLIGARESGRITALLRNPADEQMTAYLPPVTASRNEARTGRGGDESQPVAILYGGSGGVINAGGGRPPAELPPLPLLAPQERSAAAPPPPAPAPSSPAKP